MDAAKFNWLLLSCLSGFGPAQYNRLLKFFGSPEAALWSSAETLEALGIAEVAKKELLSWQKFGASSVLGQKSISAERAIYEAGAQLLVLEDCDYPALLAQIHNPPPVLFVQGPVQRLNEPLVAIVGSRRATPSGLELAETLAKSLCEQGLGISSGMALGIDAAAHKGALEAEGLTVAVMGVGIDQVYPRRNVGLQRRLLEQGGVVVTEFLPGVGPQAANFPRRNRVISGLSLGVLVVEAQLRSGSLITARLAMEQNREVFALPGSVRSHASQGCNSLIKEGATLVCNLWDILEALPDWADLPSRPDHCSRAQRERLPRGLSKSAESLLLLLCEGPMVSEQLLQNTGMSPQSLAAALAELELRGHVSVAGGQYHKLYA